MADVLHPELASPELPASSPVAAAAGLRAAAHVPAAVILAVFAFGAVMVATMVRWGYVAAALLLLAAVPRLLNLAPRPPRIGQVLTIAPVAVVVPVVALLGVDVLWSSASLPRPAPAVGLGIAGVVIAGVASVYLLWVGKAPPRRHRLWSMYAAGAAL